MRVRTIVAALLLVVGAPVAARATIDMAGTWTFSGSEVFAGGPYTIRQTGPFLHICREGATGLVPGLISPDTGAITFYFTAFQGYPLPNGYDIACSVYWDGTVSADGNSLVGHEVLSLACIGSPTQCPFDCLPATSHDVTATRVSTAAGSCGCGDGVVDPGETCDSFITPFDRDLCCSADCTTAKPAGSICRSDANECTDDVCNDTGQCSHQPNTAACGTTCVPGTCSGGSCNAAIAPAGTPCGSFPCDLYTCDGAGLCTSTSLCNACEECRQTGCQPIEASQCEPMTHGRLDVRIGRSPAGDTVRWRYEKSPAVQPFADPLNGTTYTLCLVQHPGTNASSVLMAASAPDDGTCGPMPCWSTQATSVRYRDPARSPNGLRSLRGKGAVGLNRTFRVSGRGPLLPLPTALPAGEPIFAALVARGPSPAPLQCWGGTFENPNRSSATYFRARK